MKHRAMTRLQMILTLVLLAIVAAVLFPVFARKETPHRSSCPSNLKQISLGVTQYTQDYDEKYPITTTEQGWLGSIMPYLRSEQLFRCPQEKLRSDNLTDYWFNRRLAGIELKDFDSTSTTLMFGDGEPSDDPNISIQRLPPLWRTRDDSPARRHFEAGNYAFADGHAKAIKPERIPSDNTTFLVKP